MKNQSTATHSVAPSACTHTTHSVVENHLFKGTPVAAHIAARVPLDDRYSYAWINVVGNCMDSLKSPLQVKHGDKIMIHEVSINSDNLSNSVNSVVCLQIGMQLMVKEIAFIDLSCDFMLLKTYNPIEFIPVSIKSISRLFIIDDVVSSEYAAANKVALQK